MNKRKLGCESILPEFKLISLVIILILQARRQSWPHITHSRDWRNQNKENDVMIGTQIFLLYKGIIDPRAINWKALAVVVEAALRTTPRNSASHAVLLVENYLLLAPLIRLIIGWVPRLAICCSFRMTRPVDASLHLSSLSCNLVLLPLFVDKGDN